MQEYEFHQQDNYIEDILTDCILVGLAAVLRNTDKKENETYIDPFRLNEGSCDIEKGCRDTTIQNGETTNLKQNTNGQNS